jgi:hypothetical protein
VIADGQETMDTPGLASVLREMPGLVEREEIRSGRRTSAIFEIVDRSELAVIESAPFLVDEETRDALVRSLVVTRGVSTVRAEELLTELPIVDP